MTFRGFARAPAVDDATWARAIDDVLAEPARLSIALQPIVDLSRGAVTGYEALARFESPLESPAQGWFYHAERCGRALEFELLAAARALECVASLPANCFLSLNVSPHLLISPEWITLTERIGRLDSIIVEVTEHAAIADYEAVRRGIAGIRAAGGGFAVDDTGSGFASLNHVLVLRPDFVKLDRVFIGDCHTDPAKRALIEMMGGFAGRLDSWIVAEGVESLDELRVLSALGVPLAQGYLLGRPQTTWCELEAPLVSQLSAWRVERLGGATVGAVLEQAETAATTAEAAAQSSMPDRFVAVLDEWRRPIALACGGSIVDDVMCVRGTSAAVDVLRRAMTRPSAARFAPLAVTNDLGQFEGVVRLERLIDQVALAASDGRVFDRR